VVLKRLRLRVFAERFRSEMIKGFGRISDGLDGL
jgi:hypothetical protein